MSKKKSIYVCKSCGYESIGYLGKCPSCSSWASFEEVFIEDKKSRTRNRSSKPVTKRRLKDIKSDNSHRVITNIKEFNRVMGGGIVKDSLTILAAKPGAGKSTLLLQVANDLAILGKKVLYASGEESESQIKNRADRILEDINENLYVVSDNSMDYILEQIDEVDPDMIIIDSIQTFTLSEFSQSRAGSPTQTMECANKMVELAKDRERPRMVIIIGQMTKEDEIAGVRSLEHLVDTVLVIEGEAGEDMRMLVATKNRYGSTGEIGFFQMEEKGMVSIDNPSEFFITQRSKDEMVAGSAITVVREGTRPIILEIESLVSKSFTPYPSRVSEALKKDQLNTLISILEERGSVKLFDKNVVVKTTGGIRLTEQSSNLAVLMSIVSSSLNRPIENDIAFIGDVGLTGELKKVPNLESRVRELDRIGYKKCYIPPYSKRGIKVDNIKLIEKRELKDVIKDVF